MASFEPFLLPPIWVVPDDEIHVISWFGNRPTHGNSGTLSKIATPGLNIIIPGAKLVGAYGTNQFPVYLFRHDTPTPGDYAELELPDITLTAKASVIAQIKGDALIEKAKNVYKAHYNAEGQDILQATERILNPYIRLVLQQYSFEDYSKQLNGVKNLEEIQISKITPAQLLQALGLKQVGSVIKSDITSQGEIAEMGAAIISKLDNIGVELILINIDDLSLPASVNEARNKSAVAKAEQEAKLKEEQARNLVIQQQNQNLLEETKGFIKAITEGVEGSEISQKQLWAKLAQYPTLEKVLANNTKVIFQGGGNSNDISNQVLEAMEASKD